MGGTANIRPFAPDFWSGPLVASGAPGSYSADSLSVDGATYISWAVLNDSRSSIDRSFFVDVSVNGLVAGRWQIEGVGANQLLSAADWEELSERVRLQPGRNTLKLVIDPTDLIPETDENDNVYEAEFTWEPPSSASATPTPTPGKLPDLAPSVPEGWTDSLIATSYRGDKMDGPLSVDVPTYVKYGLRNEGLASFESTIWAYIYLDGVLVSAQAGNGLLAEETVGSSEWAELSDAIHITPGVHTLRLEVDATDLIDEADEGNNVIEKEFTWGTGGVPPKPAVALPPAPTAPEALALPNLTPGWRLGWDGPIMASHQPGTFLHGPLSVEEDPFIDVVIHNASIVDTTASFTVDLYFDGMVVHTFDFPEGMESNRLWWNQDWDGLAQKTRISEGPHTLKMVIDPDNVVKEANEDDNVYEVTLTWGAGAVDSLPPIAYTTQELKEKLADLPALIETRRPAVSPGKRDYTQEVLDVTDAGYFLLTGKSLRDERVNIYLLNRDEYLAWIDDHYAERFALNEASEGAALLDERERLKTRSAGLEVSRFGRIAVVVDAERGVADVIGSLVHELGHMRQELLNPAQGDGATPSSQRKGLQEAQAQQFERAFWLALEELTGMELLSYPDHRGLRDLIGISFDSWFAYPYQDEHFLGYLVQWLSVMDDPNLTELKQEVTTHGRLGWRSSLALYYYLVGMPAEAIEAYVDLRLQAIPAYAEAIKALTSGRLVAGLHPDSEGSPGLREPGLLAP